MAHPAEQFIRRFDGPLAISGGCTLCPYVEVVHKPREGSRGRGWGFREGNKLRGRLIQHVKEKHGDKLK